MEIEILFDILDFETPFVHFLTLEQLNILIIKNKVLMCDFILLQQF